MELTLAHSKCKPVRIFVGPSEIAGHYQQLAHGFRSLGYETTVAFRRQSPYLDEPDIVPSLIRSLEGDGLHGKPTRFGRIAGIIKYIAHTVLWSLWVLHMIGRNDVFFFAYGKSLLPRNMDLPILRMTGKRIVMRSHGSDLRAPYLNGALRSDFFGDQDGGIHSKHDLQSLPSAETVAFTRYLERRTKDINKRRRRAERYATAIVAHPLCAEILSHRGFVNGLIIGLPVSPARVHTQLREDISQHAASVSSAEEPTELGSEVVVLHAPSRPNSKGTPFVREAVQNLRERGLEIDYRELIGVPPDTVLSHIQECHVAVDQLYSDTPMAGFACEVAQAGKPVIVGGYGWEFLNSLLADSQSPPTVLCHPNALEETLEQLISDSAMRSKIGRQLNSFVSRVWRSDVVAKRMLQVAFGDFPESWLVHPSLIPEFAGYGLTEEQGRTTVRLMVENLGSHSLGLSHKPVVQDHVINWAYS